MEYNSFSFHELYIAAAYGMNQMYKASRHIHVGDGSQMETYITVQLIEKPIIHCQVIKPYIVQSNLLERPPVYKDHFVPCVFSMLLNLYIKTTCLM